MSAAGPVPPNTQDKLEEARYFLQQMETTEGRNEFRYDVSAFLSAIRSVKDTLKSEIAASLRGGSRPANMREAKAQVETAMSADAEMRLLVEKRDVSIHQGMRLLDATWEEVDPWTLEEDPSRRDFLHRERVRELKWRHERRIYHFPLPPTLALRWFFVDINDRDAYTVCEQHLAKVTRAVEECVARHASKMRPPS